MAGSNRLKSARLAGVLEREAGPPADGVSPVVHIRCFGGFTMTVDGYEPDWTSIRPKARAVLRLLSVRTGQWLHRDRLVETFWPKLAMPSAVHNLQVAVSSLRGLLEPDRGRGEACVVVRQGLSYRLRLPHGGSCDVTEFERAVRDARMARRLGRWREAAEALCGARDAYAGPLLPEEGASEWVVGERERLGQGAAWATDTLAELRLRQGRLGDAVETAERCLEIDPFRDSAWDTLIRAHDRSGQSAAGARARRRYADMLASLGIDPATQRSSA
ncbi:winged helix-turn-helix domain-containing protein [Streptomycetaceae bacterium NBC_01309]